MKILNKFTNKVIKEIKDNADLCNADLSNANLSNANLFNANLCYTNLYNADLRNADLSNADIRNANLFNANLCYADLLYTDLRNTDLSNANLSNANLCYANLYDADLRNADLSNANLSNADLLYANLYDANLSNAVGLVKLIGVERGNYYWKRFNKNLNNNGYQFYVGLNKLCKGEEFASDERILCSYPGFHFGSRSWCAVNYSNRPYEAKIQIPEDAQINEPWATNGKASADMIDIIQVFEVATGKDVTDLFRR